jgi:hypothetical protein
MPIACTGQLTKSGKAEPNARAGSAPRTAEMRLLQVPTARQNDCRDHR